MAAARPAYRVFDEQGNVLVLRSDMTVPIARVVATRYAHAEPPFRFCYFAHAYRGVRPQRGPVARVSAGRGRADRRARPAGHGRGARRPVRGARRRRPETYRIGLGDASLYPSLLEASGRGARTARELILAELAAGDFVGASSARSDDLGARRRAAELLLRVPRTRGGAEVLEGLDGALHDALSRHARAARLLAPEVAERVIFDLGLVRSLGYYTGAVFQVYDPAYGVPLGSGGRYDELLGQLRALAAGGRLRAQRRARCTSR